MGTGSRGGGKLPRKILPPEGRNEKMQPRESAPSEKGSRRRNSPPGSPNAAARWWCSGEKGYRDRSHLLRLLLPRTGRAKPHPWHLSCPAGGGRLGITNDDFGQSRGEFWEEEGEKGTGSSTGTHTTCFTCNIMGIHETARSRYATPQNLTARNEFLKLKGSVNAEY